MKWLLALCLVASFQSCQTKPDKASVDYEKIRPKTSNEKKTNQSIQDSATLDLICFNHDSVALDMVSAYTIDTAHFLDRFTSKSETQHLNLKTKNAELIFGAWKFRDSIARKNAVFNWLDRFGEREISVPWLKPVNLGAKHYLILFNERSVFALTSASKPSVRQWLNYQRFNFPKDSVRYVLTGRPNKKCQWYKVLSTNKLLLCQP
jgi:hypothetical protein